MIDLEKLKNVKRLVTHANCPDGIASALIVKDALPDVEVLFVAHGTKEHINLPRDPGTLFCDFTPAAAWADGSGSWTQEWIDAGAIVLDHHPTQRDLTMKFVEAGLGAYGENDRKECGAWLAYEHVWLPLFNELPAQDYSVCGRIQEFANLAAVRDTWKKDDPRWQAACEQAGALLFWGFGEFSLQDFVGNNLIASRYRDVGKILFEKQLESARKSIGEAHSFRTQKGTQVIVFQGVTPTSDAAELIEKDWDAREQFGGAGHYKDGDEPTDIVAGFHYRVDAGKLLLQFSTRSHTGYDVGAFCKSKGGGGHRAAAGFTVDQSPDVGANPYAVFKLLLEEWEQGQ